MSTSFPEKAYVAALLRIRDLSHGRLAALLGQQRARPMGLLESGVAVGPQRLPSDVWKLVLRGEAASAPALRRLWRREDDRHEIGLAWARAAAATDLDRVWAEYRGVRIDLLGAAGYPSELADDPEAPWVLFRTGSVPDLAGRRVAIVGTRRATAAGRDIAIDLGRSLARAGVRVISGLALGIDGAAHEGALEAAGAPPIGVVAGGFDAPYPVRHRYLWDRVAATGCLVSESPLGVRSEGWRFPARNRIIAGLAEVVVVVESRAAGGSITTADMALGRGIPVLAVPGSIRNPAAAGTNALIRDGAAPVCGEGDVLLALGISDEGTVRGDDRPLPDGPVRAVLDAVGWEPTSTEQVVRRCGLPTPVVVGALARLEVDGWVRRGQGSWERAGR